MRKVEILAPAGSYESLKAAIYAGCDAVYIGGSRFGARAFANNLAEQELLEAIDFVHLHGKKIYMTVNTLLKEQELYEELYDYLKPYYEQGLDAVIVQDVGVLKYVHEHFPDLPIHASTQMTLTGKEGIKLLKDMGVTRFVPARELSLEEIKEIRKETQKDTVPIEIETFVHGALCYCYSGQCLLSSMIGGRSGNRGRCAQPCRMTYTLDGAHKDGDYLLSPKDICTVSLIPELIEAGVHSFKIEGRMKRPEYTAYATYIYGKYTDLYFELGKEGYYFYLKKHQKEYEEDISNLMDLYNRGSFTTGYYKQYHGKDMMSNKRPNHNGVLVGEVIKIKGIEAQIKLLRDIYAQDVLEFRNEKEENLYDYTVKDDCRRGTIIKAKFKPGSKIVSGHLVYRTKNQKLLSWIGDNFLENGAKIPIEGKLEVIVSKPLRLYLTDKQSGVTVEVMGDKVEEAKNQPMTKEKLLAGVGKIANTEYIFEKLTATVEGNVFVPVGKLKELRREGLQQLEYKMLKQYRRVTKCKKSVECIGNSDSQNSNENNCEKTRELENKKVDLLKQEIIGKNSYVESRNNKEKTNSSQFFVTIWTKEQAEVVCKIEEVKRVAILIEHFFDKRLSDNKEGFDYNREIDFNKKEKKDKGDYVLNKKAISEEVNKIAELICRSGKEFFITLPYIDRKNQCEKFLDLLLNKETTIKTKELEQHKQEETFLEREIKKDWNISGFLVRSMEQVSILQAKYPNKNIVLDANVYTLNQEAKNFWEEKGVEEYTTSVELNISEIQKCNNEKSSLIVYGHLPLMVSAQCLLKNYNVCQKERGYTTYHTLKDRMGKEYLVVNRCENCYNVIYDGEPISLLKEVDIIKKMGHKFLRLDFTVESKEETKKVIECFKEAFFHNKTVELQGTTKGHFYRGIE